MRSKWIGLTLPLMITRHIGQAKGRVAGDSEQDETGEGLRDATGKPMTKTTTKVHGFELFENLRCVSTEIGQAKARGEFQNMPPEQRRMIEKGLDCYSKIRARNL